MFRSLDKLKLCLFLLLIMSIAGCASQPYKGISTKTNPYTVRGQTYYPLASSEGFMEVGHASWYGPGFHGKLTASGETFNQNALTAAHKHLPLGTYVYVEHLGNGKRIRVKINDRGPFIDNRVIDLSRRAAIDLGMLEQGVAKVRIIADDNASENKRINAAAQAKSATNSTNSAPAHLITNAQITGNAQMTLNELRLLEANGSLPSMYELNTEGTARGGSSSSAFSSSSSSSQTLNAYPISVQPSTHISHIDAVAEKPSDTPNFTSTIGQGSVYIYLGTYSSRSEASAAEETVKHLGLPSRIVSSSSGFVLQSGPYPSTQDAENRRAVLQFRFKNTKVVK